MEVNFLAFGTYSSLDHFLYIASLSDICQLHSVGEFPILRASSDTTNFSNRVAEVLQRTTSSRISSVYLLLSCSRWHTRSYYAQDGRIR
jgi:hypothetical protein